MRSVELLPRMDFLRRNVHIDVAGREREREHPEIQKEKRKIDFIAVLERP